MYNINYDFTHKLEGSVEDPITGKPNLNLGYWPGGNTSGLTIAKGIDLAHFSKEELQTAGVLEKDIKTVEDLGLLKRKSKGLKWDWIHGARGPTIATAGSPHDTKIRENGKNVGYKVEWHPSSTEAMQKYVENRFSKSAADTYNKLVKNKNFKFDQLSQAQQSVLYSITYNAGENFIERKIKDKSGNYKDKDLKKAIENNDWIAIENELLSKDWDSKTLSRRNAEGRELRRARLESKKAEDTGFFFPDDRVMNEALG